MSAPGTGGRCLRKREHTQDNRLAFYLRWQDWRRSQAAGPGAGQGRRRRRRLLGAGEALGELRTGAAEALGGLLAALFFTACFWLLFAGVFGLGRLP